MTRMLASVQSVEEARLALAADVDLIDIKDPSSGALGAVSPPVIHAVLREVNGRCPVSATVGDLPMDPRPLADAVARLGQTGVDYVKVGLLPHPRTHACVAALAPLARAGLRIVAVLFADRLPFPADAQRFARADFAGIMLDTAGKSSGRLTTHMDRCGLKAFVDAGRDAGLLVGLAGSLEAADVRPLAALGPDLLGFRRALCAGPGRSSPVTPGALAGIRGLVHAATRVPATAAPLARDVTHHTGRTEVA